jgi:hydrogenase nickel incorporation protein HypB
MCETCGCGNTEGFAIHDMNSDKNNKRTDIHKHEEGYYHEHPHAHPHNHSHEDDDSYRKIVNLNIDILSQNNKTAAVNRAFLEGRKVLCLNMVSSPGSGKTTILEKTIGHLVPERKIYVIEGDQQTLLDGERIKKAGAPAIQINTGSACHLDAQMVEAAIKKMDPDANSVLFIENVGNLVCPAMFDLGEFKRVVVTSVTEGDDKPLKYPFLFETSHLCIINKSDLLPYVDFQIDQMKKHARIVNPDIEFITVSAKTEEGMDLWYKWIVKNAVLFSNPKKK